MFYDKEGKPLETLEFAKLVNDRKYTRIDWTDLPGGRSVSTIWLGIDQSIMEGPPIIFETALLETTGEFIETYGRSGTLEHAKEMHDEALKHYENS